MSRRIAAAAYFFCVLAAWAMLRPLRDEIATRNSARLPWLFTGSLAATLVVVPVAAAIAARVSRRRLLPALAGVLAGHLLVFSAVFGRDAGWWGPAFFFWWNVFSLLAVSMSWSVMTDLFPRTEDAGNSFATVAAGGTAGTLAGPAVAAAVAGCAGPGALLPGAAILLAAAAIVSGKWLTVAGGTRMARRDAGSGALRALRSSFLRRMSLSTVCYTSISTLAYFLLADVVASRVLSPARRTACFAGIDLAVNVVAFLLQIVAARAILRRFGPARALAFSSAAVAAALAAVAIAPGFSSVVVLQIVHRAGHFAVGRPAREALFVPHDVSARFEGKSFIDTAVSRGSDAASAWLVSLLKWGGIGAAGAAAAAIPLAILWTAANRRLGDAPA